MGARRIWARRRKAAVGVLRGTVLAARGPPQAAPFASLALERKREAVIGELGIGESGIGESGIGASGIGKGGIGEGDPGQEGQEGAER